MKRAAKGQSQRHPPLTLRSVPAVSIIGAAPGFIARRPAATLLRRMPTPSSSTSMTSAGFIAVVDPGVPV